MKPVILFVLLALLCGSRPSRNYFSPEDFGVYLAPDPNGNRMILIKSNYYVTEGKADDLEAAKLGIDFWHGLNDQFFLLAMDSAGKLTDEFLPIHFELKIVSCEDPLAIQKLNDSLGSRKLPGSVILNTFFLVDTIHNEIDGCRVRDPELSAGLTCGISYSRVKRNHKNNVKVIAHEIGHTLGLLDMDREAALMHEDTSGGVEVYEFEIRMILDHAFDFKLNWFRNHFDPSIPRGKIVHISGRAPAFPAYSVEFRKKDKNGKRK